MQIRIVGTAAEVAQAAERMGTVLDVLESSGSRPRRTGSQVSLYLEVRLPATGRSPTPRPKPAPAAPPDDDVVDLSPWNT
jgi:hypothetical protein